MRKFYSIFALCAFLFFSVSSRAADYTIFPDADVPSYALPLSYFHQTYAGSITQQIYWAEELTDQGATAGSINSITFYYTAAAGTTASAYSRNIQIYLMEIDNTTDEYTITKPSYYWVSSFLHDNSTKKAGTKVYEGALSTQSVTASNPINLSTDVKSVTIPISAFPWDGSKNIVMTIADVTNTVQSSANLRFLIASTEISSTSYPRFAYTKWPAVDNERLGWIDDFSGSKYADRYGYTTTTYNTEDGQKSQRSYVNKVTFSISATISAPTNLAASSITTSSATLSWNPAAGATGYNVRWGKTSGNLDHSQNNVAATSLAISDLDDDETYFFDVQTITSGGTSTFSSEYSFKTLAEAAHIHDGITFSKWASTTSLPTSGNYYLNADVAYDFYEGGYLDLAGDLNLCLNGHTIDLGTKSINVTNGHTMTLFDHVGGGKITGFVAGDNGTYTFQGVISVENGGTLVLREGEVENTYPAGDPEYKSIAIASGGTLIISGEPAISSNEIDIFLAPTIPAKVITIESGKPLTNSTPYKVYKSDGVLTSGWANMSGADPKDHFVSANPNKIVCLKDGEAALRTALNLSESSDNDAIGDNYNKTVDVNLTRRTLTSASYNTICLPFALSNAQLEEVFGVDYDLEELIGSSLAGDELTLSFDQVTSLEAGKPYLLQPSVEVTNPSFEGVTIGATAPVDIETSLIDFKGTFNPTELEVGNHNILCLGASNSLFWPNTSNPIKGFRAYFEVKGDAKKAKAAHIVKKEDQAQALDNIENTRPAQKRILNGQLVIEKNGTLYNAQGQIVK